MAAGPFDKIPVELQQKILGHLDLRSLSSFQAVNARAKAIVKSLPILKIVAEHARPALCGINAIRMAEFVTLNELVSSLLTPGCQICGEKTDLVHLLMLKRVCLRCVKANKHCQPLKQADLAEFFRLPKSAYAGIAQMIVVPGRYAEGKRLQQMKLFDYQSAQQAAVLMHGSMSAILRMVAGSPAPSVNYTFDSAKVKSAYRFASVVEQPCLEGVTRESICVPRAPQFYRDEQPVFFSPTRRPNAFYV